MPSQFLHAEKLRRVEVGRGVEKYRVFRGEIQCLDLLLLLCVQFFVEPVFSPSCSSYAFMFFAVEVGLAISQASLQPG